MKRLLVQVDRSPVLSQLIPLILTLFVFGVLISLLHGSIRIFNLIPFSARIVLDVRVIDIFVGATIYLKTSIDFAIFMGRLMAANPGWRNRIAIEIGTALGNTIGTIIVIGLWVIFKDIHLLLALMVLFASLVLFELAYGSLPHFREWDGLTGLKKILYQSLFVFLSAVKKGIDPFLSRVMPDIGEKLKGKSRLSWKYLLWFSTSVPFILGLDDFAGYVPLFSVVNVFGFAIGVIGAHTALNICLFVSPKRTIGAVKNAYISFFGTLAFIGLAFYGLWESLRIIIGLIR